MSFFREREWWIIQYLRLGSGESENAHQLLFFARDNSPALARVTHEDWFGEQRIDALGDPFALGAGDFGVHGGKAERPCIAFPH